MGPGKMNGAGLNTATNSAQTPSNINAVIAFLKKRDNKEPILLWFDDIEQTQIFGPEP